MDANNVNTDSGLFACHSPIMFSIDDAINQLESFSLGWVDNLRKHLLGRVLWRHVNVDRDSELAD